MTLPADIQRRTLHPAAPTASAAAHKGFSVSATVNGKFLACSWKSKRFFIMMCFSLVFMFTTIACAKKDSLVIGQPDLSIQIETGGGRIELSSVKVDDRRFGKGPCYVMRIQKGVVTKLMVGEKMMALANENIVDGFLQTKDYGRVIIIFGFGNPTHLLLETADQKKKIMADFK